MYFLLHHCRTLGSSSLQPESKKGFICASAFPEIRTDGNCAHFVVGGKWIYFTAVDGAKRRQDLQRDGKPAPTEPKPQPAPAPTEPKPEIRHHEFSTCLQVVKAGLPLYLYGPAGTGKNVICSQIAKELGVNFYYANSITQEYKFTGFVDANGNFHDTEFYKAFKFGGLYMIDELDASIPEVLVGLNAAIANGYFAFPNGEHVTAHEDFRVVAAGNTIASGADDQYTGRFVIDAATMNRFVAVKIDYDPEIEKAISGGNTALVDFCHDLRKAVEMTGAKLVVSYRQIKAVSMLQKAGLDAKKVLDIVIFKGLDASTRRAIVGRLDLSNVYANFLIA